MPNLVYYLSVQQTEGRRFVSAPLYRRLDANRADGFNIPYNTGYLEQYEGY